MDIDKIEMMFNLLEYEYLSDAQHELICRYDEQFISKGYLSESQFEVLADIFKQAAEK